MWAQTGTGLRHCCYAIRLGPQYPFNCSSLTRAHVWRTPGAAQLRSVCLAECAVMPLEFTSVLSEYNWIITL